MIVRKIFFILCNKGLRVILYKLHFLYPHFLLNQTNYFFIPPLFYHSNWTQKKETKIFSIIPLFYSLLILYLLIFPSPPPNESLSTFNKRVEAEQKKKLCLWIGLWTKRLNKKNNLSLGSFKGLVTRLIWAWQINSFLTNTLINWKLRLVIQTKQA